MSILAVRSFPSKSKTFIAMLISMPVPNIKQSSQAACLSKDALLYKKSSSNNDSFSLYSGAYNNVSIQSLEGKEKREKEVNTECVCESVCVCAIKIIEREREEQESWWALFLHLVRSVMWI